MLFTFKERYDVRLERYRALHEANVAAIYAERRKRRLHAIARAATWTLGFVTVALVTLPFLLV